MHGVAVAVAIAGTLLAGCAGQSSHYTTFQSSPDHLWLAGDVEGRTEFAHYNWTFTGGRAWLEWRGTVQAGEMHITLWDPDHDVAFQKSFSSLSPPSFVETTTDRPAGLWTVGVTWSGFAGHYSFEGRELPASAAASAMCGDMYAAPSFCFRADVVRVTGVERHTWNNPEGSAGTLDESAATGGSLTIVLEDPGGRTWARDVVAVGNSSTYGVGWSPASPGPWTVTLTYVDFTGRVDFVAFPDSKCVHGSVECP